MRISGPQIKQLRDILSVAFSPDGFRNMLLFSLDIDVNKESSLNKPYKLNIQDMIEYFNERYQVELLIEKAQQSNPFDPHLSTFARQLLKRGPELPAELRDDANLERTIKNANGFLDPISWQAQLAAITNQVCRVEIPTSPPTTGTGFLLGPDVVITNYHVMESVIEGYVSPGQVTLRFDYTLLSDGVSPNHGTLFRLASDWLIDSSKPSNTDQESNPSTDPKLDQLDYALLRVADLPGCSPIGGANNKDDMARKRLWIKINREKRVHELRENSPILIMQHPIGSPLKLAMDLEAIINVNANRTRVRYRTNTEAGSSGSPCFDINWNLVALHHAGDPNFSLYHEPEYNQGIPILAILNQPKLQELLNDNQYGMCEQEI